MSDLLLGKVQGEVVDLRSPNVAHGKVRQKLRITVSNFFNDGDKIGIFKHDGKIFLVKLNNLIGVCEVKEGRLKIPKSIATDLDIAVGDMYAIEELNDCPSITIELKHRLLKVVKIIAESD